METLKKYKSAFLAGAGAAVVGWLLYKATAKPEDQTPDEGDIEKINIEMNDKLYSKKTVLAVYKVLHKRTLDKTFKLIIKSRKKRRSVQKNVDEYIKVVTQTVMKRDEIIDKIKNQSFQELNINPALWEKTLEKYAMDNSDEGFNKQLSDLISDFPEDFKLKKIPADELDKILDFMMDSAEKEEQKFIKEIVALAQFDSTLGIEVLEARVYDKVNEKFEYEEDDIQISLRELPENHEIHKKFENFQELVDEITSGFHDYEKEQIEPAYEEDASDNEEDYEDIEDD